jgi:hypothetical protein
MRERDNVELVQSIYSAFARGDMKSVLAPFADGLDFQHPMPQSIWPWAGSRSGRQGYELVKGRNLRLYADADMRLAASRAIALEMSRGWRISKERQSHKIDVIVALAQAALGAVLGQGSDDWKMTLAPSTSWMAQPAPSQYRDSCQAMDDAEDGVYGSVGIAYVRRARSKWDAI